MGQARNTDQENLQRGVQTNPDAGQIDKSLKEQRNRLLQGENEVRQETQLKEKSVH